MKAVILAFLIAIVCVNSLTQKGQAPTIAKETVKVLLDNTQKKDSGALLDAEIQRIDQEIVFVQSEQEELLSEQAYLDNRIAVLNSQQTVIDNIFRDDDAEFAICVGTQRAMIETLDSLIAQINNDLAQAKEFIERSDLFEDLKKLGKGKHIEVLAQITAHLDQDLIAKILVLFAELRQSTVDSIADEEEQQLNNIKLYQALRAEISRLITETNTRSEEVLNQIQQQQLGQQEARLSAVEDAFVERQEEQKQALQANQNSQ